MPTKKGTKKAAKVSMKKRPAAAKRSKPAKRAAPKPERTAAAAAATLTKAIAERFLKDPSATEISGFTQIDDAAAAVLAKSNEVLGLGGLTQLSDAAAESLAGFKGWSLYLGGLKQLSDVAAKAISSRKPRPGMAMAGTLDLGGVRKCSDTAITFLASLQYDLKIGVASLSDNVAKAFSAFPKTLTLPRVRTLSDAAAKSLEKLDREGRLVVSRDFCKTMQRLCELCCGWKGRLRYRGWKIAEKKVKWKDVPEKPRKVLSNAFDYGVHQEQVVITRVTLTAPKGGEQHEYFVGEFDSSDMDIGWTYVVNDREVVAEDERD